MTIAGYGADKVVITGNNTSRIFSTTVSAVVSIKGVTLTGGNGAGAASTGFGGAILAANDLTLDGVQVTGNNVPQNGGGVYFFGGSSHRIHNSTFSSNSANGCGAFENDSVLTIANTTISDNTAWGQGGGLCNFGNLTIRNATIAGNTAATGGGIFQSVNFLNLGNTLIAANTAASNNPPDIHYNSGSLLTAGSNLIGVNTSVGAQFPVGNPNGFGDWVGDQITPLNPMLSALGSNGGTTRTRSLLSGSPAIDKGDNAKAVDPFDGSPLSTDQRGFQRIVGGLSQPPLVDIGAYEFVPAFAPTAAEVSVSGRVSTSAGYGISRARVILTDANGMVRTSLTNAFGFFSLRGIRAGSVGIIEISSKRYTFRPRLVAIDDALTGLDFVADK
ncbi:MAG: choice-of-anchor Q domain-containing protein [Pyrinomonadaceae bacterium]